MSGGGYARSDNGVLNDGSQLKHHKQRHDSSDCQFTVRPALGFCRPCEQLMCKIIVKLLAKIINLPKNSGELMYDIQVDLSFSREKSIC